MPNSRIDPPVYARLKVRRAKMIKARGYGKTMSVTEVVARLLDLADEVDAGAVDAEAVGRHTRPYKATEVSK